jgi:ribokinase
MPEVVVLGSANVDLVLRVNRIPLAGETMLSTGMDRMPGGKGSNQAIASARSGMPTKLIAAVGADADGALLRTTLDGSGVDVGLLRDVPEPTGLAVVSVADGGENSIVVASGANASLTGLTNGDRSAIARATVLLAQLETPIETFLAAASFARVSSTEVILNAAPSTALPDAAWDVVDMLIVNEHEAADLIGDPGAVDDPDRAVDALLERVGSVVITLGAAGSRYGARGVESHTVAAPRVDAVDTTAAGDTYCGVLAASSAAGVPVAQAIRRASVAASLCVERPGAASSIPVRDEIDERMQAVYGAAQ